MAANPDDNAQNPVVEATQAALVDTMEDFLKSFRAPDGSYRYFDLINNMMAEGSISISVDYIDLDMANPGYSTRIIHQPDEILEALKDATIKILETIHPDYAQEIRQFIRVRVANYTVQKGLREINASDINKMIGVSGMVVRTSEVKPLAIELAYRCGNCGTVTNTRLEGLTMRPPNKCPACNEKELQVEPAESRFIDFQIVRIQELPEDLPAGQLPHHIDVTMMSDIVNKCRPGDRIILTGIVRLESEELIAGGRNLTRGALFRLRMEGNNIEYIAGRTGNKESRISSRLLITDQDMAEIQKLAARPDAYERLIKSFAPNIYGNDLMKESILLLLVGSVSKRLADDSTRRGDINILLIGDPGVAKSEMLKFAARVAPRGLYTSGRGSTAAGLTAAVVKDKSGMMLLEAGAVVLADTGMAAIDEFDKIKADDRTALHEVMEQQTCSVAKGGIFATLNARTSILAAANPVYGKYDAYRNLTENVNLPIPLLTRFDLMFIMRDQPEKSKDLAVARHILSIHKQREPVIPPVEIQLLTKYIAHAKENEPVFSDEAAKLIEDYYMEMRKVESDSMITVTPRQLEALVRLATAKAKLLLKESVDSDDAKRAIALVDEMLKSAGVDVNTGKTDLGVLYGKPQSEVSKSKTFMDVLKGLAGVDNVEVEEKHFISELVKTEKFADEQEARKYMERAKREGQIFEKRTGYWAKA